MKVGAKQRGGGLNVVMALYVSGLVSAVVAISLLVVDAAMAVNT